MKKSKKKAAGYATRLTTEDLTPAINWDEIKKSKAEIPDSPEVGKYFNYKFEYRVAVPPGKFDSSAAREHLEKSVGYKSGQCLAADDSDHLIKGLLVEEIKRLRQELESVKYIAQNYLSVLEKEKEQEAKS